jgi:hypothetical protein
MQNKLSQIIAPLLVVTIALGVPLWDKLDPMDGASEIITKESGSQMSWCVAFAFSSNSEKTVFQRIYILFPQVFSNASLTIVKTENEAQPTLSTFNYGALFVAFVYANLAFGLWQIFRKRNLKSPDETNREDAGTIGRAP